MCSAAAERKPLTQFGRLAAAAVTGRRGAPPGPPAGVPMDAGSALGAYPPSNTGSVQEIPVGNAPSHGGGMLLFLWMAGVCIGLLRLGLCLRKDYAAIRRCKGVTDQRVEEIVSAAVPSPKQRYRVLLSPDVGSPGVAGFFAPFFLFPQGVTGLTDGELRDVARHEWCHYCHHDIWYKLAVELIICLFWWNIPVYLLRRDMDQLLEIRCDLELTRGLENEEKAAYLSAIIKSIQTQKEGRSSSALSLHLLGTSAKADIKQRFQMVARYNDRKSKRMQCVYALVFALLWVGSFSIVVQPYYKPAFSEEMTSSGTLPANIFHFVPNQDGSFDLYWAEKWIGSFEKDEIARPPYCDIPIILAEG